MYVLSLTSNTIKGDFLLYWPIIVLQNNSETKVFGNARQQSPVSNSSKELFKYLIQNRTTRYEFPIIMPYK